MVCLAGLATEGRDGEVSADSTVDMPSRGVVCAIFDGKQMVRRGDVDSSSKLPALQEA